MIQELGLFIKRIAPAQLAFQIWMDHKAAKLLQIVCQPLDRDHACEPRSSQKAELMPDRTLFGACKAATAATTCLTSSSVL